MQLLLAAGADPNIKDSSGGSTPLIWAAINKRADMVKLLISRGADPNLASESGSTALHSAGNAEVAQALLAGGANPNAAITPADTARYNRRWDVLAVLTNSAAGRRE